MRKLKLLASISAFVLSLAMLVFGVYSASTVNYTSSGTLTYTVKDVFVTINTKLLRATDNEVKTQEELDSMFHTLQSASDFDNINGVEVVATKTQVKSYDTNTITNPNSTMSTTENFALVFDEYDENNTLSYAYYIVTTISNDGNAAVGVTATTTVPANSNTLYKSTGNKNIAADGVQNFVFATGLEDVMKGVDTTFTYALSVGKNTVELPPTEGLEYGDFDDVNMTCSVNGAFEVSDTDIVIPRLYNGYQVTSIYDYTFLGCTNLNSVTIPDTVTSIGWGAFCMCESLTSVTIPDSVTSIEDQAFEGCSSLTSITIPSGVTSICDNVFSNCSGLTSVTIPSSVTSIGDSAFWYCTNLTSVVIPDSVISIGYGAFAYCSSLTSVTIPDSVTSIGNYAFSGCSSLTSVAIPDTVTSIGNQVFEGCSSLTSISIPNSVTSIGSNAFGGSGLTSITIPASVTSIGNGVLGGCSELESITVDTENQYYKSQGNCILTKDGSTLIFGCEISQIPDNITSIGANAFSNTGLTSITIPNSVTSIGNGAFRGCSYLTSVTISNNVTSIGTLASWGAGTFEGCGSLTEIIIPDSIISIGVNTFRDCSSLSSVIFGSGLTTIGNYAFIYCSSLTSINIPSNITSIGDNVFGYCNLESITVDANNQYYKSQDNCLLTKDGSTIIRSCRNGIIPAGVTIIGSCAFSGNSDITNIVIPNNITSIGEGAFIECINLTSITIPASVTSIGLMAFYSCDNLSVINFTGTQEQWNAMDLIGAEIPYNATIVYNYVG